MAIKVFLLDMKQARYGGNPADTFFLKCDCLIATSSGGDDGGPRGEQVEFEFSFPVSSSPSQVYAIAYQMVLDKCVEFGFETPAKTDIYAWTPVDFGVLLP
jgi:hypothetical protein